MYEMKSNEKSDYFLDALPLSSVWENGAMNAVHIPHANNPTQKYSGALNRINMSTNIDATWNAQNDPS